MNFPFTLNCRSSGSLIPKNATLDTVGKGFGFTEGPVWDPAGFLYVSDEEQNKIYKLSLDGQKSELIALGDPDGSTYDREHRLIDCASVLRAIIRITTGRQVRNSGRPFRREKIQQPE